VSSNVRVLASTATAAGYRLAGLTVVEVGSPALTTGRLDEIASDADVKIILIEQRLLDAVPAAVRRAVDRRAVPPPTSRRPRRARRVTSSNFSVARSVTG